MSFRPNISTKLRLANTTAGRIAGASKWLTPILLALIISAKPPRRPPLLLPRIPHPLALHLDKTNFPAEYKNDAIVALHGSWNRAQLSGYKLVRVKFNGGNPTEVVDFATGWLKNNQASGRPVDVIAGPDGALYVSDDGTNVIYRISYKNTL